MLYHFALPYRSFSTGSFQQYHFQAGIALYATGIETNEIFQRFVFITCKTTKETYSNLLILSQRQVKSFIQNPHRDFVVVGIFVEVSFVLIRCQQ